MIFYGAKEEIDIVLEDVVNQLNGHSRIFLWKEYIPKNSRTALLLFTYYVDMPSVLTAKELRSEEKDSITQEVKVEFIMQNEPVEFILAKKNNIFAVNSDLEYQILSMIICLPINLQHWDQIQLEYKMIDWMNRSSNFMIFGC